MSLDFAQLRVLVVDDHPGMRTSIRTTLSHFGVTKTDMASTAYESTRRIKNVAYDVIVCDYNLGDGRDGQQLLEELRHTRLIPLTTVFLMVTAERSYERVMSAAELAPDDYLIKPFTAEVLMQRLNKVIAKKAAFTTAYLLMEEGKVESAIAECDQILLNYPPYTIDAIRLKAELLIAIGNIAEAQTLYQKVIALRAVPWARMGLARSLFLCNKLAEAEKELVDLCEDAPDFLSAFDQLAKVQEGLSKQHAAQKTLQHASERSPNNIARQKVLGETALANGELAIAEKAFRAVVEKGTHSVLRGPEDHGRLARVQIDQGKLDEAGATLKDLRQQYHGQPEAEFTACIVDSLRETKAGRPEAATAAIDAALKLQRQHGITASDNLTLDLARACLAAGRDAEGKALIGQLINNDHENTILLNKTKTLFAELGRSAEGEELVQGSVKVAVGMNNEAVLMARKGDLAGAVQKFIEAAGKLPNNTQILLNAAQAILTLIKQDGWSPLQADVARKYLERARGKSPDHPKVAKVITLFREISQKYGVLKDEF